MVSIPSPRRSAPAKTIQLYTTPTLEAPHQRDWTHTRGTKQWIHLDHMAPEAEAAIAVRHHARLLSSLVIAVLRIATMQQWPTLSQWSSRLNWIRVESESLRTSARSLSSSWSTGDLSINKESWSRTKLKSSSLASEDLTTHRSLHRDC